MSSVSVDTRLVEAAVRLTPTPATAPAALADGVVRRELDGGRYARYELTVPGVLGREVERARFQRWRDRSESVTTLGGAWQLMQLLQDGAELAPYLTDLHTDTADGDGGAFDIPSSLALTVLAELDVLYAEAPQLPGASWQLAAEDGREAEVVVSAPAVLRKLGDDALVWDPGRGLMLTADGESVELRSWTLQGDGVVLDTPSGGQVLPDQVAGALVDLLPAPSVRCAQQAPDARAYRALIARLRDRLRFAQGRLQPLWLVPVEVSCPSRADGPALRVAP